MHVSTFDGNRISSPQRAGMAWESMVLARADIHAPIYFRPVTSPAVPGEVNLRNRQVRL